MIVSLAPTYPLEALESLSRKITDTGTRVTTTRQWDRLLLVTDRPVAAPLVREIREVPGVLEVVTLSGPLRLTAREWKQAPTQVQVGSALVGGSSFVVAAGPCAVENADQLDATASSVASAGAGILRGGAFKPRTSPYSFQGLGLEGLELLARQSARTNLPVVTEVLDNSDVDSVATSADMLQIGTRNMQNYTLLKAAGRTGKPVLLKRGFAATVDEWLQAAEYILAEGNENVVLCERGIRSFDKTTRFTLDLSVIPVLRTLTHLPVIVDPSHAVGRADLVAPMALAAAAAGADGLIIDVHTDAASALCDANQALSAPEFEALMDQLEPLLHSLGRHLAAPLATPQGDVVTA